MPYCIYLRKSRADVEAEARQPMETLARHEKTLLDVARIQGLPITQVYREVVSGDTIASRPAMQRLLREVQSGLWQGVLVMEVERLARGDTIDQGLVAQAFGLSDTRIITPAKTYDPNNEFDQEYFEFGLFMSRREYKAITRRLQRGRAASVKEGKFIGNTPPYGYIRVKLDGQKGWTLKPDQSTLHVVRMIFDWYTSGTHRLGVSRICKRLNELRIPASKGGMWVTASILDILRNPVYAGKIRHMSRPCTKRLIDGQIKRTRPRAQPEDVIIADGLHEPIISLPKWEEAQRHLQSNKNTRPPAETPTRNPLRGLMVCGVCGRRMSRRPSNKAPDMLVCPLPRCKNVGSYMSVVEERLLKALEPWLAEQKITRQAGGYPPNAELIGAMQKISAQLEDEMAKLTKQRDSLHDLLEQGVYGKEIFLSRSQAIATRISETQTALEKANRDVSLALARRQNREFLFPAINSVSEVYQQACDPALRNKILCTVLEKVVYLKSGGGRWGDSLDFSLEIFPKQK